MWSGHIARASGLARVAVRSMRPMRPTALVQATPALVVCRTMSKPSPVVEKMKAKVAELREKDKGLQDTIKKLQLDLEKAEKEREEVETKVEEYEVKLRSARGSAAWTEKMERAIKAPEALVVNIFAQCRRGLLVDITRALLKCNMNLEHSQWTASGGQMSIMMKVSKEGLAQTDADLVEKTLKELQLEDGDFVCKVMPSVPFLTSRPIVTAEAFGLDRPGITAQILSMLEDANIEVTSIDTRVVPQPQEGVHMFRQSMGLSLDQDYIREKGLTDKGDQVELLDQLVHEIEQKLDPDIQLVVKE
eukprot:m.169699 g.169699  ORF g.169699 m.169699 type:complete len:304 (+) comp13135_c0_seq1:135-1046(+)